MAAVLSVRTIPPPNVIERDVDVHVMRHRLLARIHRRYQTIEEQIEVDGQPYRFTRVADPDRVLDEVAEEEDRIEKVSGRRKEGNHLHLPYWAALWDAAVGMGYLLSKLALPWGSVLDLGCGMGFSGMVAASLGHRVLLADLEPPALLFAKLNSLPYQPVARTRVVDWQTTRLAERFDVIVGADIVYERSQWQYLEPFWRHHLAPGGRVLLGEPTRGVTDGFAPWARGQGWRLKVHTQRLPNRERQIRLFEMSLA
jgi:predicted nicotinamide N-methyase